MTKLLLACVLSLFAVAGHAQVSAPTAVAQPNSPSLVNPADPPAPAAAPVPAPASVTAPGPGVTGPVTLGLGGQVVPTQPQAPKSGVVASSQIDTGDTAWVLTSTALVLMMTLPGLAFFYAGLVRKKNIIGTMTQVFGAAAITTVMWIVIGYSLAFSGSNPYLGSLSRAFADHVSYFGERVWVHPDAPTVPESVFMMFQGAFAIIASALVVGAFAERVKFGVAVAFCGIWSVLVYAPVAHWIWQPGGWLDTLGEIDYAGGTVVHVNAGAAALAVAMVVGPRKGYGREPMIPSNIAYMLIGASLLWVGWFGFNAGSAYGANASAGLAMVNTQTAAAVGAITYVLIEIVFRGQASMVGLATGAVAGLVCITPAAGFVTPSAALVFGGVGGLGSYLGVTVIKRALRVDDSLDVFAIHGVVGILGSLLTPVFASKALTGGREPSFVAQLTGVGAVLVYSFVVSFLIMWLLDKTIGARVSSDEEIDGLDLTQHGEQIE